jgi:hypothetical protein
MKKMDTDKKRAAIGGFAPIAALDSPKSMSVRVIRNRKSGSRKSTDVPRLL